MTDVVQVIEFAQRCFIVLDSELAFNLGNALRKRQTTPPAQQCLIQQFFVVFRALRESAGAKHD